MSISAVIGLLVPLGFLVAYSSDVARPIWIQRHAPPDALGRVFSPLELPYYFVSPLAILAMGAIATRSLSAAFYAAALLMLLAAMAEAASPTVRRLSI